MLPVLREELERCPVLRVQRDRLADAARQGHLARSKLGVMKLLTRSFRMTALRQVAIPPAVQGSCGRR